MLLLSGILLLGVLGATPAHAAPGARGAGFAACRRAIAMAARDAALPAGLLEAVAVVESGRPDADASPTGLVLSAEGRSLLGLPARPAPASWRPWPWTINADGVGQFFATKAAAIAAVRELQAAGVHSIDVGCLQVNLRDHPHAFRSLDEAFDPAANARYAGRFLDRLFARLGGWPAAVAAYHSETPALGQPYRQLVFARWRAATPATPARAYADFQPQVDRYADFGTR
jgi:hypothetical protein